MVRVPSHLSAEAKRWWKKIQKEYDITDEAGLLLLQTAMESFDRMRSYQRRIEPVLAGRWGSQQRKRGTRWTRKKAKPRQRWSGVTSKRCGPGISR